MDFLEAGHIIAYFMVTTYLAFVCGQMLPSNNRKGDCAVQPDASRQVRCATAVLFMQWDFSLLAYVPLMLFDMPADTYFYVGGIVWYLIILVSLPTSFWALEAFLQFRSRYRQWLPWVLLPETLAFVCFLVHPVHEVFLYSLAALLLTVSGATIYLYRRYRYYAELLYAEYSDLSRRELTWTRSVWLAMMAQLFTFIFCTLDNSRTLSYIYMVVLVVCSVFITRGANRMLPLSEGLIDHEARGEREEAELDVPVDEAEQQAEPQSVSPAAAVSASDSEKSDSTSVTDQKVHSLIRQKLRMVCEGKRLYLNPDLTRETLSAAIKVNRTYLSRYFREEGTTYYNYINKLRIEYAVQLIKQDPGMPLIDVCMRSGFSSTSTFRRSFREFKGCLPSEYEG